MTADVFGREKNTAAYAPKLRGGDQNISREKAFEDAMVSLP